MIEILFNMDINIYTVAYGMTQYEFESEADAIQKAECIAGEGNYFINPMIDVDTRYTG